MFSCEICERKYTQIYGLNRHIKENKICMKLRDKINRIKDKNRSLKNAVRNLIGMFLGFLLKCLSLK